MVHPTTPRSKSRAAGAVFALLVLLGFAVVNLPYRYTHGGGAWIGRQMIERFPLHTDAHGVPVMAGWPFRYQIDYVYPERVERRWWSYGHGVANGVIALLLAVAVYTGTQYRHRTIDAAVDPKRMRMRFDIAIALAILLTPAAFWSVAACQAWRDLRLARRAADNGACFLSWQLPEAVASRLPGSLKDSLRRIRRIHLDDPPEKLVRRTAQVPTLSEYHVDGGTYQHEALAPLRSARHLGTLCITGRDLDSRLLRAITAPCWISYLSLAHTNVDITLLGHLDRLDSLRVLDLAQTPLRLDRLGKPPWSQTVEHLRLPRPPSGRGDRLTLDHWPRLQRLSVKRLPLVPNDVPLELRLTHLPELNQLSLDRVQKHDLVARDLPRLIGISENFDFVSADMASVKAVPGGTWLSRLQLDRLPSLSRLTCFAPDLEVLSIRRCPRLQNLELTPFWIGPGVATRVETVEPSRCQRWIDALGQGDGPAELHLNALPLSHVDLDPLANNEGIRCLKLSHTGVRFEQLRSLAPLRQLERLDVADCPLHADQLEWLLERFPKLEQLRGDLGRLQRLEIVCNQQLEQLGENRIERLRDLRICDAPRLRCGIHMVEAPQRIEIRDAPGLTGLAVEGPWPEEATVRGMRKLRWFAAGGPEVDDALVESLFDCDELKRLTLAYGSVSRRQLVRLGRFDSLTHLELPGADIDDSVTQHWHAMQHLRAVNLDDTAVSAETLDWLGRLDGFHRLSLRRMALDEQACQALARLTQLTELDLHGTPVPPAVLAPILASDVLERLDLSGHRCAPPLIDLVAGCDSLRTLVLQRTDLEPQLLERLLSANPDLHVVLEPLPPELAPGLVAELGMRRRRALDARSASIAWTTGFGVALALPTNGTGAVEPAKQNASAQDALSVLHSAGYPQAEQAVLGEIDVHRFRP